MKKQKKISYTVYVSPETRDLCKYIALKLHIKQNEVFEEALINLKKALRMRISK